MFARDLSDSFETFDLTERDAVMSKHAAVSDICLSQLAVIAGNCTLIHALYRALAPKEQRAALVVKAMSGQSVGFKFHGALATRAQQVQEAAAEPVGASAAALATPAADVVGKKRLGRKPRALA